VLADIKVEGKTLIVATHDLGRLADADDATIHLQNGLLVQPLGNDVHDILVNQGAAWTG
jgi:ABC-type ATPase involved in cell division